MKLIIDIDENVFTRLFDNGTEDYAIVNDDLFKIAKSIRKGTPLDDVKAEIAKPIQEECCYIGEAKIQADTIKWCLEILDNIGKADMREPKGEKGTE